MLLNNDTPRDWAEEILFDEMARIAVRQTRGEYVGLLERHDPHEKLAAYRYNIRQTVYNFLYTPKTTEPANESTLPAEAQTKDDASGETT